MPSENLASSPSSQQILTYASDPMAFFRDVLVPGPDGPVRLGNSMAVFQERAFEALAPCILALAGGRRPPYRGFWLERTKGASKDSDIGLAVLWLLLFSPRALPMEAGANDQDQAKEMMKAMADVVRLNPWIGQRLEFQRYLIRSPRTGSQLDFLTSDASGAHGSRPVVSILNELSHVESEDFAATMMDNNTKVPGSLAIIATNAGRERTWQWRWRETYRQNPRWWFQKVDKPAPWIPQADIDEARFRNSTARFNRLWFGVWSTGEGDAIDAADIQACVVEKGPMAGWEPGWVFLSGTDLGVRHDHSAIVVLGFKLGTGRVRLAECRSWAPGFSGKVDLAAVRHAHIEMNERFGGFAWSGYDPSQMELMAQELAAEGLPMEAVDFSGRNLDVMARSVLQIFRNRRIALYPDDGLVDDLHRLTIVEKSYGHKLQATRDERGHADRATALAIVLPTAIDWSVLVPEAGAMADEEPRMPCVIYTD